jgi:glutamate racemase
MQRMIQRMAMRDAAPVDVGVFDSGVGGLSVLREVRRALPRRRLAYVADSAYVPYGTRPPAFIRERALAIGRYLVERRGARVVVAACNTATAHAVDALRSAWPHVPVVGMEPAIKPASAATRTGVVGILATGATLGGERVASLIERNADGIEVVTQACPGLVEQVEAGDLSSPETIALVRRYTAPLLARGADTIVLGCTHFPFLRDAIAQVAGPAVRLIDSGEAVARQTARVLAGAGAGGDGSGPGCVTFATSGDVERVRPILERLWGEAVDGITTIDGAA